MNNNFWKDWYRYIKNHLIESIMVTFFIFIGICAFITVFIVFPIPVIILVLFCFMSYKFIKFMAEMENDDD